MTPKYRVLASPPRIGSRAKEFSRCTHAYDKFAQAQESQQEPKDDSSDSSIEIIDVVFAPKKKEDTKAYSSRPIHPFFLKNNPREAATKTHKDFAGQHTKTTSTKQREGAGAAAVTSKKREFKNAAATNTDDPYNACSPGDDLFLPLYADKTENLESFSRPISTSLTGDPTDNTSSEQSPTGGTDLPTIPPRKVKKNPATKLSNLKNTPASDIIGEKSPKTYIPQDSSNEHIKSILPLYSYLDYSPKASAVYIKNEEQANELVKTLEGPLGFDLEWRVMWSAGAAERRTAAMKRFPQGVLDIIESPSVVKTGANILNDGEKLFRDFGIHARNLVELGSLARQADPRFVTVYNRQIVSLAKMVAMYLHKTLKKGKERTANWEGVLNSKMIEYAASDAHCALMVHERLIHIAAKAGRALDPSASTSVVNTDRSSKLNQTSRTISNSSQGSGSTQFSRTSFAVAYNEPPRPQHLRAFNLWHHRKMPLKEMCMTLKSKDRAEPLKESTVISYVIGALQADTSLPFNMDKLKELVRMESSSWQRHRQWILENGSRS
ncbi:hypothetical protein SERLADRAFT_436475 [Serpula lacrymans var. lacrymans S7.9]|uniref:3'-5' exonuclease domain-containing protein n=1 Tax=Serpula lacrymans var. lacrymans (strain S7.9) TaxID=578457 RepID=F8NQW6_SERL9|nr:uncharacterized protein SERLADRAFT_436475 [Serpula lacrymans var. lacrymans S7.9]EGO26669.1 hypothetical protein SERLADRAFT_436475 [Serpula lacrymans var. lacrymans S7.9]